MNSSMNSACKRLLGILIIILFLISNTLAQPASPTRTDCKQWDDAFLALFEYALWGTLLVTFFVSLLAGAIGKYFWLFTAPRMRIIVMTVAVLMMVILGVALGPWVVGLGHLWFGGVDPRYFDCETVAFSGDGLLGGMIGAGVAAIAQWPIMTLALAFAAMMGGLIAWITSELANRFLMGVPAKIEGEAE